MRTTYCYIYHFKISAMGILFVLQLHVMYVIAPRILMTENSIIHQSDGTGLCNQKMLQHCNLNVGLFEYIIYTMLSAHS